MKSSLRPLSLLCLLSISFANALSVSQKLSRQIDFTTSLIPRDDGASTDLTNARDMLYFGTITVGGNPYKVQLDTGSSDLWIKGQTTPLPNTTPSSLTRNLTYGIGYVFGKISHADVTFSSLTVHDQAFLDVTDTNSPTLTYSAEGILGLGFTGQSAVDQSVNVTGKSDGRTFLYNLFAQNMKTPNYITFALQRASQPGDEVKGAFTIGELNPKYVDVAKMGAIPTWPENANRWTVRLDAVLVGNSTQITPTTTVPGVPTNQAIILVDTGSSFTYVSPEVAKAIYGDVPGARYDSSQGYWYVPCNAEIDVAFQINGQVFPLHPLDMHLGQPGDPSCLGTFATTALSVGGGEFDWIVGANFLRGVYSYFDFGDFDASGKMGAPYIKLLSLIDPDEASEEFHAIRGGEARRGIVYNPVANAGGSTGGTTTITLGSNVAQTLDKVGKYFPAMLGVMALNALVLLALVVVGILLLIKFQKKQKASSKKRQVPGRMSPMPLSGMESMYLEAGAGPSRMPHSYVPVSMALTEDTFVPPSPQFRKFEGSGLKDFERPASVA